MSDEMTLDGNHYISSKRAAEVTGYAQDYIGQLARSGSIDARRVGGLWFISENSIVAHKNGEMVSKIEQNTQDGSREEVVSERKNFGVETFVTIDGKSYISANRASKLSGYNQDYVGQLARSGQILSRLVGKRWYVEQDSLLAHKREKDALLAEVQSQSVGFEKKALAKPGDVSVDPDRGDYLDNMRYFSEERDLIPAIPGDISETKEEKVPLDVNIGPSGAGKTQSNKIPIRISAGSISSPLGASHDEARAQFRSFAPSRSSKRPTYAGVAVMSALTIVVVVSLGFAGVKGTSTYANIVGSADMMASVSISAENLLVMVEDFVSPPLRYVRTD